MALLAMGGMGCGALDFEISEEVPEQRVEGSAVSALLDGAFENPVPLDVDVASETEARDTGPAEHVRLTEMSLSITETARSEGDEDDFGFLDSVDIYVESTREGSELPRQRVARAAQIEDGTTTLHFETMTDVDLLPYVNEGARMISEAEGTAPPDDVTFDGEVVLLVEVL